MVCGRLASFSGDDREQRGTRAGGSHLRRSHGTDSVVLRDGDIAEFGRAGTCRIRFGYTPTADLGVPRVAGRLVVAAGRVFVEARDAAGRSALAIVTPDGPPVMVGAGDGFCPAEASFRIVVHSEAPEPGRSRSPPAPIALHRQLSPLRTRLTPTNSISAMHNGGSSPPTTSRSVRGRLEPATHREVAEQLGCHHNTAHRGALHGVGDTVRSGRADAGCF